jgi:hypothetical protein
MYRTSASNSLPSPGCAKTRLCTEKPLRRHDRSRSIRSSLNSPRRRSSTNTLWASPHVLGGPVRIPGRSRRTNRRQKLGRNLALPESGPGDTPHRPDCRGAAAKSAAPRFIACTALATVPNAVTTMTGLRLELPHVAGQLPEAVTPLLQRTVRR